MHLKSLRRFRILVGIGALVAAGVEAFAVEAATGPAAPAAPVATTEGTAARGPLADLSASYTVWLTGPRVKALDGVADSGHALKIRHFPTFGYDLGSGLKVSATQYFTTWVRNEPKGERNFQLNNPYLTLSSEPLWQNRSGAKLDAYVRYYLPLSHDSADNVGKRRDTKRGLARVKLDPSQTFFDGFLTVNMTVYAYRAFAGAKPDRATPKQLDWYLWLNPRLSVQASDRLFPFLGYLNVLEHYRYNEAAGGGSGWSKLYDQHQIELGINWLATNTLMVSPYLEYGGDKWVPRESALGVIVDWALL